jgi:hypothetical protein
VDARGDEGGGGLRRTLRRTVITALVIAVMLIATVIVLDTCGSQSQPFRYILH